MALFIRKIEMQKWNQNKILSGEVPSADAITGSLRTINNTLSLWEINDVAELQDAILAIVSQSEKADSIDILIIDPELVRKVELSYERTKGLTPYDDFVNRHLDLTKLDYISLGKVADIIIESIRQKNHKRITRAEIKALIIKAIETNKIRIESLNQKLKDDLKLVVNK